MAAHKVSPLAPVKPAALRSIKGCEIATGHSGMRYRNRDDLMLMRFARGTAVAGLFTQSSMPGAPVEWCRRIAPKGRAGALLVNAGIANVFTGKAGTKACNDSANAVALGLRINPEQVFLASTGVIGQLLPAGKIVAQVPALVKSLSGNGWRQAAEAIRTTDTFAKLATARCKINGRTVTVNGICKGSGMIAPDMATMLAFIVTDAAVVPGVLRQVLREENDRSFNCLTVDGDTSTSDTLLLFATGGAGNKPITSARDARLKALRTALHAVMSDLARQIAKDGEGAQKFVTINVTGAEDNRAARVIARAIANSPLVKTAIAGADANWGRIIMAVGKSGERADRDRIIVKLGGRAVTRNGMVRPDHDEAAATAHFKGRDVVIDIDVGIGRGAKSGSATVWTCDLTHGYIEINADYRS